MKSWLLAPLFFLQPLADQPPSCFDLPVEQRAACQAEETPPPPPVPDEKETAPPDDNQIQNGYEFSSPETFTGKEEGAPGY